MRKLVEFFETDKGKRVKNFIIGWGASLVLLGALFKIMHWPGAGLMLTVGMTVEAFIFALQGTIPPHKDYYWEKLYPDLNISPDVEGHEGGSVIQQLDKGLKQSHVGSDVVQRLGDNLRKLGDNVSKMSDLTDASVATNEYAENAREAARSLGEMSEAYGQATGAASMLVEASEGAEGYRDQMQLISKNLSSLNELYELEIHESNSHMQTINKFYDQMNEVMGSLEQSVEDTKRYTAEVSSLAENISVLNAVYGNMLSAITSSVTR